MGLHIYPQGRQDLLKIQLGLMTAENWLLHLYENRHIPVDGDTTASFIEQNFQGYSAQTLTTSSWTVSPPTGGNLSATATYPAVTWTCTQGGSLPTVASGYFVTGQSTNHLVFAELFSLPLEFGQGDTVTVQPTFSYSSQF